MVQLNNREGFEADIVQQMTQDAVQVQRRLVYESLGMPLLSSAFGTGHSNLAGASARQILT